MFFGAVTSESTRPDFGTVSEPPGVAVCSHQGIQVAFYGRLDNRTQLAVDLGCGSEYRAATRTVSLLTLAWQRWGYELPARLCGDFVLAIVDTPSRRLLLVRDPLGSKPLYFSHAAGRVAFATRVPLLRQVLSEPLQIDQDWVARYLMNLSWSYERTAYHSVVKLPPAHALCLEADGQVRIWRYFAFRDDPPPARCRAGEWVDAYRSRLEEAIRCRMEGGERLGTENSGGLDSAAITAYLGKFVEDPGERLHAFAFAQNEEEPGYILQTSQHVGIRHNYVLTGMPPLDEERVDRALGVLGYPEEHPNAVGHELFYQECQSQGISLLFSGFGGDEVVTNHAKHLRWELLDGGNWGGLWETLPGNPLMRSARLLKALANRHRRPQYYPEVLAAFRARWPHHIVRDSHLERLDLARDYWQHARFDAPYQRINDAILHHQLSPVLTTRLENCTLMAASYGVEYCWPLLDTRLIQQYLSTPSIEKYGPGGMGRYLHRRAISSLVPPRVAWKSSKDMGEWSAVGQRRQYLLKLMEHARRAEANLHPLLDELIERDRLRTQIRSVVEGQTDQLMGFQCMQNARRLVWLNRWLQGSEAN